jgi:FKBP-type peptidyl-prolyl cis-trans isomerase FkpA
MTEITRVPLKPIAKGSLTKLWVGVAAVVLAGGAVAWAGMPGGVEVETQNAGTGGSPGATDVVLVNYTGRLVDGGKVFDQGQGVPLPLSGMIPGFAEGLQKMEKGGTYTLTIPAAKAYGSETKMDPQSGEVVIPANSDIEFEIELIDFMSEGDFQRRMQAQQQMMQQMQEQMQQGEGAQGN